MASHTSNTGTRTRGPRGTTGPGSSAGRARNGVARAPRATAAEPTPQTVEADTAHARWTSRAAVLTLVVAVLLVSYASSLRAYVDQRTHINDLQSQIALTQAEIEELEAEKARWDDPAYVVQQARERLGYVMPGERSYLVLDANGQPLRPESELDDPASVLGTTPTPWWSDGWASVELAGDPPKVAKLPEKKIDGSLE